MIDFVTIPRERMRKFKELKKKLEELTSVKIDVDGNVIKIEAEDSLSVIQSSQVIHAFARGFDANTALTLLGDEYKLEIIEIQKYTGKSKRRLITLRGRLIGTNGKTKAMIETIGVKLCIYGKTVAIIGRWDKIPIAKRAVEMILRGAKHNSVYRFLEEQKIR